MIYQKKSDLQKALEFSLLASDIWKKLYGENYNLTATAYTNIGEIYRDLGQLEEALEFSE